MHAPVILDTAFRDEAGRALAQAPCRDLAVGAALVLLFDSTPWQRFRDHALPLLSAAEQVRAQRFRNGHHRDAYVLAHAIWRLVLGTVLELDGAQVLLTSSPEGQPQLPGTPYATSLSHTGNMVAIALTRAACVGIDIEQSPTRVALRDLSKVVCTPAEIVALEQLSPAQRDAALLALWTRKEALLKAFGVGLRESPDRISADAGVLIAPPPSAPAAPACRVHPLTLKPGLVGALATPASIIHIATHWIAPPMSEGIVDTP
ncbi:hypothetical protein DVT68_18400 [Dyella solisilvae]|uniref:4'-phosphopantetheinyl transferase domain-containing protein n=1 Tax=Dyella solisilvae TaxID=1920168 RepID=A0A370K333_9GAMM|nr:4'-phosphopantetheinyl transferase superfamily protein [Dyella solisilvae]RDI97061.1 hypothetical protein DVT68_18400 [Dyella solisilvae]